MSNSSIRAVFFDMGGTLEDVYYDDQLRLQATRGFRDLLAQHDLDPGLSIPGLGRVLITGQIIFDYAVGQRKRRREARRRRAGDDASS